MIAPESFKPYPPLQVGEYVLYPGTGEGARVERAAQAFLAEQLSLPIDGLAAAQGDPALLAPVQAAIDAAQWADVLHLGREIEPSLIHSGHWGDWGRLLEWMRQAARQFDDPQAEAWALHQLGIRALCLGDHASARAHLTNAFRLRQRSGDRAGEMVTCAVLDLFLGPPQVDQSLEPLDAPPATDADAADAGVHARQRRLPPWAVVVAIPIVVLIALCGLPALHSCQSTPPGSLTLTAAVLETLTPSLTAVTPTLPSLVTPTPADRQEPTPTPIQAPTLTPTRAPTNTLAPSPVPTITPTPDQVGPPPATLSQPAANAALACAADKAEHPVRFQWSAVTDPSGIKKYELSLVQIAPAAQVYPTQSFTSTQPVDVKLPCNKTYRWRVRAIDGAGNLGGWSEERQFSVVDKSAPAAPVLSVPGESVTFDCPSGQPIEVLVKWAAASDPSGIARYEVELTRGTDSPVVEVRSVGGNQVQALLSASCGQPYTWRVRATDGVGNVGGWSAQRAFKVGPPPPDLIVSQLQTLGQPEIQADGQVAVPIRFTVYNQGGASAGPFRVAPIYSAQESGPFAPLFVGLSASEALLAPAAEISFIGQVILPLAEQGKTVDIRVIADSCLDAPDLPAHCRVFESDETNNLSAVLRLALPLAATVTLRPSADATVDNQMPARVYGAAELLVVARGPVQAVAPETQPTLREAWSLLRFDLTSIPRQATIRRAVLWVEINPRWTVLDAPIAVEIVQVTSSWQEHAVNWETRPALAAPDTEIHSTSVVSADLEIAQWEITPWVQSWVDGTAHHGVALYIDDPDNAGLTARCVFSSRESATPPRLVIEYVYVPGQEPVATEQPNPDKQP